MKRIVCGFLIITMLAALFGCGKKEQPAPTVQRPNTSTQAPTVQTVKPTEQVKPLIQGNDVFGGKYFNQMLWGYYEAAAYDFTGNSEADTENFRKDMTYLEIPSKYGKQQLSALPVDMQLGGYSQFMSAFSYEENYNNAYTEKGKALFRKAYMERFGDLTEEGFRKIEKLLQLNVAQVTFTQPNGVTQINTFAYEIQNDVLTFYNMSVDEKYDLDLGDVYVRYHFLHDGGKLILDYNGVRREYLTHGYKEEDKDNLRVAGFARNRSEQYENLEGFILSAGQEEGYQIEVALSNDVRAVDPAVTFDKATGDFSVTWTKSAYYSGEIQHSVPRQISGKLIPCTNYGFNGFSGFHLIVDGTCYSYLVSEEEYKERKQTNIENADMISDPQLDKLSQVKIGVLAELEQAYETAEIPVDMDFVSGQITVAADRLFGADSQELTEEGKHFLQRFMEIATAVILKEEYSAHISRIVIEGHTGAAGSYSNNETLSMNRADTVAKSCAEQYPDLGKDIQFTGCACDYPVYHNDGSVNADASNRMVFRFLLAAN